MPAESPRPLKPHLTIARQIDLLQSRGMEIDDPVRAGEFLRHLGYYRFSGYAHIFRRTRPDGGREERFVSGASFRHVTELCLFDDQLRGAALEALGAIEVSARSAVAHLLGAKDPLAHRNPDLLREEFVGPGIAGNSHAAWLQKHDSAVRRAGKEAFVRHHRQAYGGRIPIWASVELWDFGMLSKFFSGMCDSEQRATAKAYGIPNPGAMASWLRAMNFVRNIAAHHGRLWNKTLVDHPQMPAPGEIPGFDPPFNRDNVRARARVYPALCVIAFFIRQIAPEREWPRRLRELLTGRFPNIPGKSAMEMGCPPEWENSDFWKRT